MTASNEPRIHVDWGGEYVTFRIGTGNIAIDLSCSQERGRSMIRQLEWAVDEIERFKNHEGDSWSFVQNPHPGE